MLISLTAAGNLRSVHMAGQGAAQATPAQENAPGVLSGQRLNPPLRGGSRVRFSLDGRYVLVQDPAGVYVVSRSPLKLVLHIEAIDSYPAQFSSDSQSITLVSWSLMVGTWRLSDGERLAQKILPIQDGCFEAEISPDGRNLACRRTDFSLGFYEISTGEEILEDASHSYPIDPIRTHANRIPFSAVFPIDARSAFAYPFGFYHAEDSRYFSNRGMHFNSIVFSPDGHQLVAQSGLSSHVRVQLPKKISNLPGSLDKRLNGSFIFLGEDRLLLVETDKPDEPMIASLAKGAVVSKPDFVADLVRQTSSPRYALLYHSETFSPRLFDVQENHVIDVPTSLGMDVSGDEVAVYTQEGDLIFYRLGGMKRIDSIRLPLVHLAQLRTATVDPDLRTMVLAVDGEGAVFHLANGDRLAEVSKFFAANLLEARTAILLSARKSEVRSLRLDTGVGTSIEAWSVPPKARLHAGGTVFLDYSTRDLPFRAIPPGVDVNVFASGFMPFRLRGIEPISGKELWSRNFDEGPPLPFVDPQGDRLVLEWEAKSAGARAAAKQDPRAWGELTRAKLNREDTLFEVLDARSAKLLGCVLVQNGGGPKQVGSAFSEGDSLIVVKSGAGVYVYSLRDGALKARFTGAHPAASAQTGLLALDEGNGRLTLFDLSSGEKRQSYHFPEEIAYIHFSGDGKRLLILSQLQMVYILDVSGVSSGQPTAHP